jgi:RNA polymerase sigma factor (sigma-70 family)
VTADPGERSASPHASPEEIEWLVRAVSERLFKVAFRILGNHADAEDAVQNAWIKAVRSWPRVGGLPTPEQQCAFMVTVVMNEARQLIRKHGRRPESLGVGERERPYLPEDEDELLQVKERLQLAWQAISKMPEGRPAQVVVLYTAGYEYGEIAEMLEIQVSTVGSHMSSARKHLRRILSSAWEGDPE